MIREIPSQESPYKPRVKIRTPHRQWQKEKPPSRLARRRFLLMLF